MWHYTQKNPKGEVTFGREWAQKCRTDTNFELHLFSSRTRLSGLAIRKVSELSRYTRLLLLRQSKTQLVHKVRLTFT